MLADLWLPDLRLPAFLVGLGFLALGCSDARRTVLQTRPNAPEGPGAAGPEVELGECVGKGIDCTSDPQVRVYQPGPTIHCEEVVDLGQASLLWNKPLPDVTCASTPCSARASTINVSTGGLTVLGGLELGTGEFWGGVWLSHFSLDGELQSQRVLEIGVGSRISEELWFLALGADAAGDVYVAEFWGDVDHPRDATLVRYGAKLEARTELATIDNVVHLWATVADDGGFATKVDYFSEDVTDPINDHDKPDRSPKSLDIARFDREGRLLWNQPKLARALELTHADIVGFDSFGNVVVLLSRETDITGKFWDRSTFQLSIQRLARLDKTGNVSWVWELPLLWQQSVQVLPNGGVYLLRKPLERKADGFYEEKPAVLEYLEPTGHSGWVLELPPSIGDYRLDVNASGHALLTTVKEGANGAWVAHLLTIEHDRFPIGCYSFELPPEICPSAPGSVTCTPAPLESGPDETFYFPTSASIGHVAAPAR
jgi:hypothetical protein